MELLIELPSFTVSKPPPNQCILLYLAVVNKTGCNLRYLGDLSVRPIKSLGQHFLADELVLDLIEEKIPEGNVTILEIGPGSGVLTKKLLYSKKTKKIIAIEKDSCLAKNLEVLTIKNPKPTIIINQDATRLNLSTLCAQYLDIGEKLVMISNLPYNVGTKILTNVTENPQLFSTVIVMLQEEVVDRIVAQKQNKSYGRLSVLTQARWDVKKLATVPPSSFVPQPKVSSAIVIMTPKTNQINQQTYEILKTVCSVGFAQRRKVLLKTLKRHDPILANLFEDSLEEKTRIEELSTQEILNIIQKHKRTNTIQ